MAISTHGYLAVLAVSLNLVLGQVSSYYPDGTLALDFEYAACDNSSFYSASCYLGEGDKCLPNGLCYFPPKDNHYGNYIYRGACTDKSWTDSVCPKLCVTETPNRYETLSYCAATDDFCCVKAVKGGDCCLQQQTRFQMDVDVGIMANLKLMGNATVSTSPTNSETSGTSNNAKKGKKALSAGVVAGIVIVVVVGVASLLAYGWWRHRRLNHLVSNSKADMSDNERGVAQQTVETRSMLAPETSLVSPYDESLTTTTGDQVYGINDECRPHFSELQNQGDAKQIDGTPKDLPEVDGKSLKELSAST